MATYDLADALAVWEAWTIAGITFRNFGDVPARPAAADCPLIFCEIGEVRGEGQENRGFTAPQADNVLFVPVICLVLPVGLGSQGQGWQAAQGLLDAYLVQTATDPELADRLAAPMQVLDMRVRLVEWNSVSYFGFQVLHRWQQTNP
jgi:hypothetical protein